MDNPLIGHVRRQAIEDRLTPELSQWTRPLRRPSPGRPATSPPGRRAGMSEGWRVGRRRKGPRRGRSRRRPQRQPGDRQRADRGGPGGLGRRGDRVARRLRRRLIARGGAPGGDPRDQPEQSKRRATRAPSPPTSIPKASAATALAPLASDRRQRWRGACPSGAGRDPWEGPRVGRLSKRRATAVNQVTFKSASRLGATKSKGRGRRRPPMSRAGRGRPQAFQHAFTHFQGS